MVVWKMKRSTEWSIDLCSPCQKIWEELKDETHDRISDDSRFHTIFSSFEFPNTVILGMFCDLHTVERSFVPLKLNSPGCLYTFVCCVVLLVPNGLYQKVLIAFPGFNLKDASWDCASAGMFMREDFQLPNTVKMM